MTGLAALDALGLIADIAGIVAALFFSASSVLKKGHARTGDAIVAVLILQWMQV